MKKSAKKSLSACLPALCLLLTGCTFLSREYSRVEAHSATYYESEDRSVLRAESYQDLVNDLLVLVTGHKETGKIRLALSEEELSRESAMERSAYETQFETPLGAYAVDYITYTFGEEGSPIEVHIGYRRSAEQVGQIIHANSVSALYDLLNTAVENDAREVVLQVGHFEGRKSDVEALVEQVRLEKEIERPWQVKLYPNETDAGIIEVLLYE